MIFVKTFKGYEDKVGELDAQVNSWVVQHQVKLITIKTALSHEVQSRAKSGDLIYTALYEAVAPVSE